MYPRLASNLLFNQCLLDWLFNQSRLIFLFFTKQCRICFHISRAGHSGTGLQSRYFKSEVSVGFPGSGVPGCCELPDVGSGIVCTFSCSPSVHLHYQCKLNGSIIDKSYPKLLNCYYLKIILTKNSLIGKCRHINTPFTKAQLQFLSIMHKDSWRISPCRTDCKLLSKESWKQAFLVPILSKFKNLLKIQIISHSSIPAFVS